ncbi:MlaD family protein [Mycobacterium talmoniae]|uniref:Mammalian cell entry protein n=2 Tax=Mycobacterium talmoniae TaxID=1858794 RepID=A0A1S1NNW9_9MYCO|nr:MULTISPECIES: MCE family protein [Mycobacterium]OHV04460.1 mammalian cell entry protein [Mycobacterium talmoniae]TDH56994.1 MCE family protein [Mycobacterium eburneum]
MPNAFDANDRGPSNPRLFVTGLVLLVIVTVAVTLLIAQSQGALQHSVRVSAELVNVGDGLPVKSDVKFRGVLVGFVSAVTPASAGHPNIVRLDLSPEYAPGIPDTVTARVVPSNVFAVSSVQLVDNGTRSAPVRSGMVITEDKTLPTVLFQTTLNKFRQVLASVGRQPTADSVGWLTALGEATSGRGNRLRDAGRGLNEIVDELNTVVTGDEVGPSTMSALTAATSALGQAAPELLDALDGAVQPMRTLAEKRSVLTHLLSSALGTVGVLGDAFDHNTDRMIDISSQLTPVVGVLSDHADTLHAISTRLTTLVSRVMDIAWNPDTNQLQAKAVVSLNPTRSYVRADCPRYGDMAGPSCLTAPEVPTAPALAPSLESRGFPLPPGVSENRPNFAPPRGSVAAPDDAPGVESPEPVPPTESLPPEGLPPPPPGPAQPQAAVIGGNVGPVGSSTEKQQLEVIMGDPVTSATQILLAPVVRGAAVRLRTSTGGGK